MPVQNTGLVEELVRDAILDWEDRVEASNLTVEARISDEGELTIDVYYQIIGEATLRTLSSAYRTLN